MMEDESSSVETQKEIYVFGDSLSDTGNLASINGPFPPPYFNNRATNGWVAVEVMASLVGAHLDTSLHLIGPAQGNNYAVSGARARGSSPVDLSTQISTFLNHHGNQINPDAVYIIFIGGNDIGDHLTAIRERQYRSRILYQAVRGIKQGIKQLQAAGARHFLVINAPDVGNLPGTRRLDEIQNVNERYRTNHIPSWEILARHASIKFNRRLARVIKQLNKKNDHQIILFDLYKFSKIFLKYPTMYNLDNVKDACVISQEQRFSPSCENGNKINTHYFFDEIHPSAKIHERLGYGLFAIFPE